MNALQVPKLSARQAQLCATVTQLTEAKGYPPTLVEVAAAMRLHPSRVHQLLRTTEAKGFIARTPRCARSMRVVRHEASTKRGR